eukprot:5613067-Pyramimonas_sp.AAC.1
MEAGGASSGHYVFQLPNCVILKVAWRHRVDGSSLREHSKRVVDEQDEHGTFKMAHFGDGAVWRLPDTTMCT